MDKKVIHREQLNGLKIKHKKEYIGFTNGCFDLIHLGHLQYLKKCKEYCDILIVGLNTDDSIQRLKGKTRPINNLEDRLAFLSYFEFIDYVTYFNENTPLDLIKEIKPDVLFKGGDYSLEEIVGYDFIKNNGGEVKTITFLNGYSSSKVIEKINNNYNK